jgi:hypothetical protein
VSRSVVCRVSAFSWSICDPSSHLIGLLICDPSSCLTHRLPGLSVTVLLSHRLPGLSVILPPVSQAQPFTGELPAQQTLPILGEKLHQVFHGVLENLTNVMSGYCLPEPFFSMKVRACGTQVYTGPCVGRHCHRKASYQLRCFG